MVQKGDLFERFKENNICVFGHYGVSVWLTERAKFP